MLPVIINGRHIETRQGATILETCHAAGIPIPTLCHDPRLKPAGLCRLCVVELKGHAPFVSACTTTVSGGMHIETHSPGVERARRQVLLLLAHDFPKHAIADARQKPFLTLLKQYGINGGCSGFCCAPSDEQKLSLAPAGTLIDLSHPYIRVDMSRCALCFKCARVCDEVQGQNVWRAWSRGAATHLLPDAETLRASSCVSCGACVDVCPTGALEDKSVLARGAPVKWTRTVCPYCGVGCEISAGTRDGKITQIKPAAAAPVNKGHLCAKGRYAFDFVSARDRIVDPMIREEGRWRKVSWAEAIRCVAERLLGIIEDFGPDAVGMLGSARATNEENYLTQKFARVVLGTNNVDCCARVCHAPSAAALGTVFGTGAATSSFDDIERAATIVVIGCNPTENHPVIGARIKQAARRGANLIVIDPRTIELARLARLHLQLHPGTNIPLLNAIAQVVVAERWFDAEAVRDRVDGFDAFTRFIADFTPENAEAISGVPAAQIHSAAELIARHGPVLFFHGLGVTEHTQGTQGVMCIANLALLTGNVGKRGAGVNPLRGQNNVQGAAHMGCDPNRLTGSVKLDEARERFESLWNSPVPHARGLNALEMIDAADAGKLRALWSIGYDVALTNPNANVTRAALAKLELVIVQDLFMNELANEFAHVFLPACSSFEKDGTFMNSERRVQRVRKVIEPLGHSQPDSQILCAVAEAMGFKEQFNLYCAEQIWNEVRRVWPAGGGISYARLDHAGLQWPCPTGAHPGTEILHAAENGPRFELQQVPYEESAERVNEEFPFLLTTGRCLHLFNANTMTGRTPNRGLHSGDFLEISVTDADRLYIADGDHVSVRSRYGESVLRARRTDTVRPGELFATFHTAETLLNSVVGAGCDDIAGTPEYKVAAVHVGQF